MVRDISRNRSSVASRALTLLLVAWLALPGHGSDPGVRPAFRPGTRLAEALRELQARGLRIVYSSRVVPAEARVVVEPTATEDRGILEELLRPHGLGLEEGPGGSLVIVRRAARDGPGRLRGRVVSRRSNEPLPSARVRLSPGGAEARTGPDGAFGLPDLPSGTYVLEARRSGFVVEQRSVEVVAGRTTEVRLGLLPLPFRGEEVLVLPSRISLLGEEPEGTLSLTRDEIARLPQLGGDVFRALGLLPGAASNPVTAQPQVRGGRRDELLVLLDGQELYEAYHLKDFDSALSLVAASTLERLQLTTGAFPAAYGDRMGGVLDLTTLTPSASLRLGLELSFVAAQLSGSGSLGERGGWLLSFRRGFADLAGPIVGSQSPAFWDALGRVDYRPGPSQALQLNALLAGDLLDGREEANGELTVLDTDYDAAYAWVSHQAVPGPNLYVTTAVSGSEVRRERLGSELEEDLAVAVNDRRKLSVLGASQSWSLSLGERHSLTAGLEWRRFDSEYDYESVVAFASPLALLRSWIPEGPFVYRGRVRDDATGVFLSGRTRPAADLTLEAGVRYDRHTTPGDGVVSPRAGLAWAIGRSVLRLAWGRFAQGHRAYELQLPDGDATIYPIERSTQWVLGLEHLFDGRLAQTLGSARLELYDRRTSTPRVRYESLFEAYEPLPEGAFDRVRIAPRSGRASGLEVSLRGKAGQRLDWWASYALGRAEDEVEGGSVRRRTEQRHVVNLVAGLDLGRRWALDLAWRYRTGLPITSVTLGTDAGGNPVPVLGPLNGERLPPEHRLDLRLSRTWKLGRGSLAAYVDVQDLYNRRNASGHDLEIRDERIEATAESWPGFFLSAGIRLEY